MADQLQLKDRKVLAPKTGLLKKLFTFVPQSHAENVRSAIFAAGGGQIGQYSHCSFSSEGGGTFKAGADTNPFIGQVGELHLEPEIKIEVVFEAWRQGAIVGALITAHPYEEVAYDIVSLDNVYSRVGSGLVGYLPNPMSEEAFLRHLKDVFGLSVVRHTPLLGQTVEKIALCGGAGSFLTVAASLADVQFYVTADVKYHEFFDANSRLVLADIGHYESEQFTINLLFDVLREKFPTFAVLKTGVNTNPVRYFL